jgi:hypothetical protein
MAAPGAFPSRPCRQTLLRVAEMDGHLVAGRANSFEIELWFFVDSYWFKRYTITKTSSHQNHYWRSGYEYFVKPLAVLEDGKLVLWMWVTGVELGTANSMSKIYDPRTKTFMDGTHVSFCTSVCTFRWNILHSGRRGAIDLAAKRLLINRRCRRI